MNSDDGMTRSARRWMNPEYRQKQAARNRALVKSPQRLAKRADQMRAYRKTEKYQQMQKAHGEVRRALKRGDLIRMPCEVCGANDTEAHHDDYGKPLQVSWLCKLHHIERHKARSTD